MVKFGGYSGNYLGKPMGVGWVGVNGNSVGFVAWCVWSLF